MVVQYPYIAGLKPTVNEILSAIQTVGRMAAVVNKKEKTIN